MPEKPPLGLTPRWLSELSYINARNEAIGEAINRYTKAHMVVPPEWLAEYNYNIEIYIAIDGEASNYEPWK